MTASQYEEAREQVREDVHEEYYFGTEIERFDFDGYERPVEADAAKFSRDG